MASTRLILGLSAALALGAGPAAAQSPQQKANTLNEQGRALIKAKKYADAAEKFRSAILLSPEGRFYLNLCMSLYQVSELRDALTACRAVASHGATADQAGQAQTIVDKFILPAMRERGIDPDADPNGGGGGGGGGTGDPDGGGGGGTGDPDGGGGGGTGDPNGGGGGTGDPNGGGGGGTGDPNGGGGGAGGGGGGAGGGGGGGNPAGGGGAALPSLFDQVAAKPSHEYTWTLGAQLLGMRTNVGRSDDWANQTGGLRILSDFALAKAKNVGAQAHMSFYGLSATEMGALDGESITALSIGGSVYKELCRRRTCLKPLVGAQVGLYAIDNDNQFAVLGARAELGFEYAMGARFENVLTAGLGVDLYLPAQESDNGADPSLFGLDKGSSNLYFAIGYTRRFNSPLGSTPLFQVQ